MSEKIKLVQGDTLPQVKVTITDDTTGLPVDITGATPRLKFRAVGDDTLLFTLTGVVLNGPSGTAVFDWGPTSLNIDEGDYEGEVEVLFSGGGIQTVYEPLKFKVRADF